MKKIIGLLVALFALSAFPQANVEKIFERNYKQLPFKIRIENSGIYGVALFDIKDDIITFSTFDSPEVFQFSKTEYLGKKSLSSYPVDLTPKSSETIKSDVKYSTMVESRKQLSILSSGAGNNPTIVLSFNNDLAFADVIGADANNNIYLIIEKYVSDVPLKINRQVYTVSSKGKIVSILDIPPVKFLYTIKDFQVDEAGNLYHFFSDQDKICIYKWSGLNNYSEENIKYPFEFDYDFNLNNYLPTKEPVIDNTKNTGALASPANVEAQVSRNDALKYADTYVLHRYTTAQANLAPNNVTGPDGDVVQTPSWLINGINAKIPYCWGGFSTLAQFDAGLKAGRYAGDINTAGVSDYAVGVDCSGFVSRCWQLSSQHTTSDMPNITGVYSSWDYMKPGDAVHKVGHVRMFVEKNANGSLRVVESSGRDWGVSYWTYAPSDLTAYTPRYYTNMVSSYSLKRPDMISAVITDTASFGTAKLTWVCDTSTVIGYRIYKSTDGVNFTLLLNENSVKTTSAVFSRTAATEYYRVSSVSNASAPVESYWSGIMGTSNNHSKLKALIIDGYEREGNWRGPGNPFLLNYGTAIDKNSMSFATVKNTCIQDNSVQLNNYDMVFWLLEDESTANETFNTTEQTLVKKYLENGGSLFVSGSEIAWDLSYKGSTDDKAFFNNYLKAVFVSDNSSSKAVTSVASTAIEGCSFNISQTIPVDYPDEIGVNGGSSLCMVYANNKGAGVQYSGKFGTSDKTGKLLYFGFPVESTADDANFNLLISKAITFFSNKLTDVAHSNIAPGNFSLAQNFPNPFNPSTIIKFSLPNQAKVSLKIYDVLGNEVASLIDEVKQAGTYEINYKTTLASGIYFYRLQADNFSETKRMLLLK